jgi:hypothetical protein
VGCIFNSVGLIITRELPCIIIPRQALAEQLRIPTQWSSEGGLRFFSSLWHLPSVGTPLYVKMASPVDEGVQGSKMQQLIILRRQKVAICDAQSVKNNATLQLNEIREPSCTRKRIKST